MEHLWPVIWDKTLLLARGNCPKETGSASPLPSQHYLPRQSNANTLGPASERVGGGREELAEKRVRPDNLRRH